MHSAGFLLARKKAASSGQTSVNEGQRLTPGQERLAKLGVELSVWVIRRASDASIPCALAATVLCEMIGRNQRLQMFLHRVAVCARHADNLTDGNSSMRLCQFEDLHREFGQVDDQQVLTLNLRVKPRFLALERGQEINDPRLPCWCIAADCSLRPPKAEIVAVLGAFDHAFERTVRHIWAKTTGLVRAAHRAGRRQAAAFLWFKV